MLVLRLIVLPVLKQDGPLADLAKRLATRVHTQLRLKLDLQTYIVRVI